MKGRHGTYECGTTVATTSFTNDNSEYFEGSTLNLMDWLRQYVSLTTKDVDEDFLRGFLGKMLFSGDEILKKTNVFKRWRKSSLYDQQMMLQNPM
ncbi:MAG: hypothetical protein IPG38_09390 [Chitinophagaceae bacterium]|nr:hypothetical protein [Chitinophagaceae bacterium]